MTDTCDRCGSTNTVKENCKVICLDCGARRDCSD